MPRTEAEYEAISIDHNPIKENKWRDCYVVPTVTSEGVLSVTFLDRKLVKAGEPVLQGLAPVAYRPETGLSLTLHARSQGTVLYEDLCKGKVPGCEPSELHWKLWQRVVNLRSQGKEPRRGALEAAAKKLGIDKIYHPEIYRRRAMVSEGGFFAVDVDEVLDFAGLGGGELVEGLVDEDEAPKKVAKR